MAHFTAEQTAKDPEFTALLDAFVGREVPSAGGVPTRTRHLVVLAALLGCQGLEEFTAVLPQALDDGLSPVEVKETVYQATAYLGIGRVRPFLDATNSVLEQRGIVLPLEAQGTTTPDNRRELGTGVQIELFGEQMADF